MDDDARQQRKSGLQCVPDPDGEVFAGWIFEAWHVIEIVMIQLLKQGRESGLDVGEVTDPTKRRLDRSAQMNLDLERMPVKTRTFMALRYVGQAMRRLDAKLLEDFHADRRVFQGVARIANFQG